MKKGLTRRQLVVASTGLTASAFITPVRGAPPEAQKITPELIEAAKKEGKVTFYTSVDLPVAEKLSKVFEAKYPGIPVQGQIAAWAAQYAVDHSPGAIAKFGMDPNDLALKALAYLPTPAVTDGLTGNTVPAPAQVEVKQLAPAMAPAT